MRSRLLIAAIVIAVVAAVSVLRPRPAPVPSPLVSRIDLVMTEIYDVAEWVKRLPMELALPVVARSKIRGFLEDLELDPEVHRRVIERLDSETFVDEVIPFALALRDVYTVSEEWAPTPFDDWLRASYGRDEDVAGFEHSMFAWNEESSETEAAAPAFDDELIAMLVDFYDALYLRDEDAGEHLEEQLACAARDSDEARAPAAGRVEPVIRALLSKLRRRVQPGGEIAPAIDGILNDAQRLRAVSISLVHFLDDFVCAHYRIFATKILREEQLRRWMTEELAKPGGGRLWALLEWAQDERRHGALVVVDGLQGHLVEALAGGRNDGVFLERIRDEQRTGSAAALPAGAKAAPAQQTDFLFGGATAAAHDDRYLGFFKTLYRDTAGIGAVGISTTPTISVRNLPLAKTGAPVAGEGSTSIPNFHFVDRTVEPGGRAYYFFGNDALQLDGLARAAGMRSLFDRLRFSTTFSCAAQYDDGAQYRVDALLNLALGEKLRDFGELRCLGELRRRAANEHTLRDLRARLLDKREVLESRFGWFDVLAQLGQRDEHKLAEKLIARIAELEQESIPELLVYYNPWPDHFAHFTGPFADEILAPSGELNRLDYWLGILGDVYADAGVVDRTLFAMAGDHGLAPVFAMLNPEVAVFDGLREHGFDFRIEKISSDEGEGPKLTDPLAPPSMRNLDAVVASTAGGNYMIDFFVGQDSSWSRQPLLSELERLELLAGGEPIDVIAAIEEALADTLDYLVVRRERCDVDGGEVTAIGRRGSERAQANIVRRGGAIFVEQSGGDLLSLEQLSPYERLEPGQRDEHRRLFERCVERAIRDRPDSWCDEGRWRLLTSYTSRPDSVVQLAHLYDTDRAGTVNLFPRMGIGYNTVVPGRHAGESFHEKDAFVGLWGRPVTRARRPRAIQLGVAPASIYAFLSGREVVAGKDGWGFSSMALDATAE